MNVVGEAPLGEFYDIEQVENIYLGSYIYGMEGMSSAQSAFMHAYVFPIVLNQRAYIAGIISYKTNEDYDWGTHEQVDADIAEVGTSNITNIYYPIKGYINGVDFPNLTVAQNAFIVMKDHLMHVPVDDGKINPIANILTDYGPHQNHMRLISGPEWIDGPQA